MTKIKICGLYRPEDIQFVNEAKPDFCGFIINFPKSHRNVDLEQLRALRRKLGPGIVPVGVFVDQPPDTVAALLENGTVAVAQLHGHEDETYLGKLRGMAPNYGIWKAFKVRSAEDLKAAEASTANMVVLDNGYGTGETFDWSLLEGFRRPYLLAGGLTPENIPEAVRTFHPYGIDISSGVETDKVKDRDKILAAVAAARKE